MRFLIIIGLLFVTSTVNASEPSTSCPSGYITIEENYLTLADTSCPSGYKVVEQNVTSCLETLPEGICTMYIPVGTAYSDTSGIYEFTSICPLE